MKAIVCTGYGGPEALELKETEKPTPNDDQVLLKVYAASANRVDLARTSGGITRLFGGLTKPKDPRVGTDVSGRVEAVGKEVKEFRIGDDVFGACSGSFAEYAVAREARLVPKPANTSFEEAAAVPVAAITALQALRDSGKIKGGQKVLIVGASGAVGTFAVQIAKSYGTEVTGVCSTVNLEAARSIGADRVIDYTKEDFTKNGELYDLICDIPGKRPVSAFRRSLKPGGRCVFVGAPGLSRLFGNLVLGGLISLTGDKKIGFMGIAKITKEDLNVLRDLLEAGKIRSVIERVYPLDEVPDALRYVQEGHARAKLVIEVTKQYP